jgi:hypothetical protein
VGLALAGCLALAITFKPGMSPAPVSRGNLEASLVNAYNDSAYVEDLVGPGLSVREVGDTTLKSDSSSQWTEADLSYL